MQKLNESNEKTKNVEIKTMENIHVKGVMNVENLSFSIPWSEEIFYREISDNKYAVYFVAIYDNEVVGYAGMWKICDEGHITNIAVLPKNRKNGIGSMLLKSLIEEAKKGGVVRMTLDVRVGNVAAQKLYSNFGFKMGGIRKQYYEDNLEDAVVMYKDDVSTMIK